ncbi:unnamed protein product [Musa hybrid cultivar]
MDTRDVSALRWLFPSGLQDFRGSHPCRGVHVEDGWAKAKICGRGQQIRRLCSSPTRSDGQRSTPSRRGIK